MALAFDFGTCNSVVARWNEALNDIETPDLPNLGIFYPQPGSEPARVIPSVIHFAEESALLVGSQVDAAGVVNHPGTFRWLKMDMLRNGGANRGRRVNGRVIYPRHAADELVDRILMFVRGYFGDIDEEIVLTVPVEAFDHYIDWLREAAIKRFPGGITFIDEATACMLGYIDMVLDRTPYCIVDFGGGTLDVSVVRTDLLRAGHAKCRILGRAGEEIGGIMIDNWLLEHIQEEEGLTDDDIASIGPSLLEAIEGAKIAISNGSEQASFTRYNDVTGRLIDVTLTSATLKEALEKKTGAGQEQPLPAHHPHTRPCDRSGTRPGRHPQGGAERDFSCGGKQPAARHRRENPGVFPPERGTFRQSLRSHSQGGMPLLRRHLRPDADPRLLSAKLEPGTSGFRTGSRCSTRYPLPDRETGMQQISQGGFGQPGDARTGHL